MENFDVPRSSEYGCKYCDRKFSNKQALGGHQNAHKVERSVEKNRAGNDADRFPGRVQDPFPMSFRYGRSSNVQYGYPIFGHGPRSAVRNPAEYFLPGPPPIVGWSWPNVHVHAGRTGRVKGPESGGGGNEIDDPDGGDDYSGLDLTLKL